MRLKVKLLVQTPCETWGENPIETFYLKLQVRLKVNLKVQIENSKRTPRESPGETF